MEIPDQLRSLFSAQVEEHDGTYVIEVPEQEVSVGEIRHDEVYRIAVLPSASSNSDRGNGSGESEANQRVPTPPVEEGEQRTVEIEDTGDQGDGLTRVERGFVVIVPDAEQGERVAIEITDVRNNVAFAEVVERISYYE